jgi:hypothetical protein
MARLKLISIHCRTTEDSTGADEAYLLVRGNRVWGDSINDGQTRSLAGIEPIYFSRRVKIELFDEDGGWDSNDHLGTAYAYRTQVGRGEREVYFTEDDASYTLTYQVVR